MSEEFDTVLNRCLDMLDGGASVEACLASFPQDAAKLRPLLTAAVRFRRFEVPPPSPRAIARGEQALLGIIGREAARPRRRFLSPILAPVAVAATLAGLALIALAIGGPLRDAFNVGTDAAVADGTVSAVDSDTLEIETESGPATILIDQDTEIEDQHGYRVDLEVIAPGTEVRIRGDVREDGSIIAERIEVRVEVPEGVAEEVEFEGQVTAVADGTITVTTFAGNVITVSIGLDTEVDGRIMPGVMIKVHGDQQADGSVLAREIDLLEADSPAEDEAAEDEAAEDDEKKDEKENDGDEDDGRDGSGRDGSNSGPG